jgi:hypothetical protein
MTGPMLGWPQRTSTPARRHASATFAAETAPNRRASSSLSMPAILSGAGVVAVLGGGDLFDVVEWQRLGGPSLAGKILIIEREALPGRRTVILTNEPLGF